MLITVSYNPSTKTYLLRGAFSRTFEVSEADYAELDRMGLLDDASRIVEVK